MDAQHEPIILPICTVQHDFLSVISEIREGVVPDDTFWVSCYKYGEPSVHGKAFATLDENDRDLVLLEGRNGIGMQHHRGSMYSIACPSLRIPDTRIAVPEVSYAEPSPGSRKLHQITAFDVSPDGTQFASGYHDGSVHIQPVSPSRASLRSMNSNPHLSTVTSVRFFPSSRVLLTAGADFSLSILSVEPDGSSSTNSPTTVASPARTFRGHTRAVTSTGIIARGRNILSGSKDGTLRLWDVPSGAQIRALPTGGGTYSPVLVLVWANDGKGPDGSFEMFDLRTKRAAFRSPVGGLGARSALHTLAYDGAGGLVVTGSAVGLVALYDIRALGKEPVVTFRRNEAAIEDVAFIRLQSQSFALAPQASVQAPDNSGLEEEGLVIATGDGLPYVASVRPSGPHVRAELVGTDCDPVRLVKVVRGQVWTAADDGIVRRYSTR
ncbi:Proteasomal ATPase-associated factor 1 [Grifola frondosa]|uniref:Proteasomal ATPase-associated factor 1 n=1 Tax=Grifola frondosa TaxID=5627 RepID=A0A1C7MBP3_GRIFR|nr:Proteasomal ATPase-associated factor 1 [Grifola frondosa]